jgi:hypothetical protein
MDHYGSLSDLHGALCPGWIQDLVNKRRDEMKKATIVLLIAILLAVLLTASATASKFEYYDGYVPIWTVDVINGNMIYDVCDPILVGHVTQPANPPGNATHGHFVASPNTACGVANPYDGTCEFTIIPVETYGDPESKPGRAIIKQCTGELEGLHGVIVIDELYEYIAKYHFDSRK